MASAPMPDAHPSGADQVLAEYHHALPLSSELVGEFRNAILQPSNPELRALMAGFAQEGYNYLFSADARELRIQGLQRDPVTYLSEAIERGAVAESLGSRVRVEARPRDSLWFNIWQGCERLVQINGPVDVIFANEAARMRAIRSWALSTDCSGARLFGITARAHLGTDVAVPACHEVADRARLTAMIARLEVAEAKSREDWRKGQFQYADYALLKALCEATNVRSSKALKRWEKEQAERAEKRQKLLDEAGDHWRPMLKALLEVPHRIPNPLELPEYAALKKLPRESLGLAFADSLRHLRKFRRTGLDEARSHPESTVSNTYSTLETAIATIHKDLEKRRMHLPDKWMAFALENAPRDSLRLLASVEWTLANHHAPETHAVMEKLGVSLAGDYYRKQWPARLAALRVKYPLKPQAGDTPGEPSQQDSERTSDHQSTRSERVRPERNSRPRGGTSNARGLFGLVGNLLREFDDEAPAGQRSEHASEPRPRAGSARGSERGSERSSQGRSGRSFEDVLEDWPAFRKSRFGREQRQADRERFEKLAGADAGLKLGGPYDHSGKRSKEFYAFILQQPKELDDLWAELHAEAYAIANKAAPSRKWLTSARAIVERHGAKKYQAILMRLLEEYEPTGSVTFLGLGTLRAFIYLAADHPSDAMGHALANYALKKCYVTNPGIGIRDEKLGNASVWALANMPDGAGVPFLAPILARTKYPKIRKKIDKALNEAAEKAGLGRADLDETTVPKHDLDRNGWRRIDFVNGSAMLVADGSQARLEWTNAKGKPVKSPTAAIKEEKERLKEAKADLKELQADLSIQPQRLQKLYLQDRRWSFDDWRNRYLEQPLLRGSTRRLIWLVETEGGAKTPALPDANGDTLVTITGEAIDLTGASIRLWHPMDSDVATIEAWRDRLEELQITQPFAQVWREVYALTDAERATRTYTNRWAAHILKQQQTMSLARLNGWTVTARMWVDQANDEPWHLFMPEHNLVAEYWVEGAGGDDPETNGSGAYSFVQTDRVTFYRTPEDAVDSAYGPKTGEALALEDVSPVVFSEVMRSCDLFTAVASIAADPNWLDRGGEATHPTQWGTRADEYWYRTNTAELVESGQRRHAMLERIIPRLAIADKLTLNDKSLVVKGTLHTYEIHLGSGACSRSGRHICIVPAGGKAGAKGKIWLPFEGDRTLSIILSKAVLLAADDKIKDPVILRQL